MYIHLCHLLLCMRPIFYASRLSTTPSQSMIPHVIFSRTGRPRRVNAWPCYGSKSACLSQEHNDFLSSSGFVPRVDSLTITNFHFHPLNCSAAVVEKLALRVICKNTTTGYALSWHRTSNLPITIRRSNSLAAASYASAYLSQTRHCLSAAETIKFGAISFRV